jgi:hypothetical protein
MPVSKAPRKKTPTSLGKARTDRAVREIAHLINHVTSCVDAGSRAESLYWETLAHATLVKLMTDLNEPALDTALSAAGEMSPDIQDTLLSLCEAVAESQTHELDGQLYETMLVSLPVAVWSRYAIPAGPLDTQLDTLAAIITHLRAHVLAKDAKVAVAPILGSIDQIPPRFTTLRLLCSELTRAALNDEPYIKLPKKLETSAELLADPRFILVGVAVPAGKPFFRWQELLPDKSGDYVSRESCFVTWRTQTRPLFAKLLPACEFEALLPDAFFSAARAADRAVRPHAIQAGVALITDSLKLQPNQLRAVVAAVGDPHLLEYRISFATNDSDDVVHGTVWPVFTAEEEDQEIERVLRAAGVTNIVKHNDMFEPEECEDCGTPLFANPDGEMVHPEWPLDPAESKAHYH